MTYKTHGVTGVVLSILYMIYVGTIDPLALILSWFAALIPDLDHPKSWLSRRMPIIPWIVSSLCEHRGVTHSFLGLVLFSVIFFLLAGRHISHIYTIHFIIGYASHLFADSFTLSGVNLFYPNRKKYGVRYIKTSSNGEFIFMSVLIFFIFLVLSLSY